MKQLLFLYGQAWQEFFSSAFFQRASSISLSILPLEVEKFPCYN